MKKRVVLCTLVFLLAVACIPFLASESDLDRLEAGEVIVLDWGTETIMLSTDPLGQSFPPAGELLKEWVRYHNGFVDRTQANYILYQMFLQMAPQVSFEGDETSLWRGVAAETIVWDSNLKRLTVQATQYLPATKSGDSWNIWGCGGSFSVFIPVWRWVMNECVSVEDHANGALILPKHSYAREFEVVFLEPEV